MKREWAGSLGKRMRVQSKVVVVKGISRPSLSEAMAASSMIETWIVLEEERYLDI